MRAIKRIRNKIAKQFSKFRKAFNKSRSSFIMMAAPKQVQSGRSMVEMLGVLAVMGILTIGALVGYNYAMKVYRVNEIVEEMNRQSILASSARIIGVDLPKDEWHTSAAGFDIEYSPTYEEDGVVYDNFFTITVKNVPHDLLEMLVRREGGRAYQILIDGIPVDDYDFKNYRRKEFAFGDGFSIVRNAYAADDTSDFTGVYEESLDGDANLDTEDPCEEGQTGCYGDSLYVCENGEWEFSQDCSGDCGHCDPIAGACDGCVGDTVCVEGECLPICWACPIGDNGGNSGSGTGSGSGSSGSGSTGSGSGSSGSGSVGSVGGSKCVVKYYSSNDPQCDPCAGKNCACGCNNEAKDCYEQLTVETGVCCNSGERTCCPNSDTSCKTCEKDEICENCPEGKDEGSKWCASDTISATCSKGSISYTPCETPNKCYGEGSCENPCDHLDCGKCGCDREAGECIEEIVKKAGDCCEDTEETCCKGSEDCECTKTENCKCECNPSCGGGEICLEDDSSTEDNPSCHCQETCTDAAGNMSICDPAKCEHCEDGKCKGCPDGQACENGECKGCNSCCEGSECPSPCVIDPDNCPDCKECCELANCNSDTQHCVCDGGSSCHCEDDCTPGDKKCEGNSVYVCGEDKKWEHEKDCENGSNGCPETCDGGTCLDGCSQLGKVCCEIEGSRQCTNSKCSENSCDCGTCDPCTGQCDPPNEDCECKCDPPCSGSQVCAQNMDEKTGKVTSCECKETCGDGTLGPCEECKPDPTNPDKMIPTYKCNDTCQDCVDNNCVDKNPPPSEDCCPSGTSWCSDCRGSK